MNVGSRLNRPMIVNILIYSMFFLAHLVISFSSNTPLIYVDEAGYIGNARLLLFNQMEGTKYFPGYSLLIIPAFIISNNIEVAYQIIQIINSMVMAFIPIISIKLLNIIDKNISTSKAYAIAIISSLYPAFLLYSNFAMTEAVIIPTFVLLVLIFAKTLDNIRSVSSWGLLLILSAYLISVHPRNVVIVPALVIVLVIYFIIKNKEQAKKIKLNFVILFFLSLIIIGAFIFNFVLKSGYSDEIVKVLSIDGIKNFVMAILGQSFYMSLSTFGLCFIGLFLAIKSFVKGIAHEDATKQKIAVIIGFAALSFIFEVILSSWYMSTPFRADHLIYGRYNEGYLLPILLLGLLYFFKKEKVKYLLGSTIIIHFVISLIVLIEKSNFLETREINWMNIFGIYLYNLFYSQISALRLFTFFTLVLLIIFSLANQKRLIILTIASLFISTTAYANYDYFYKGSQTRMQQKSLVDIIKIYQAQNTEKTKIPIYFDENINSFWHYYNYIIYVPKIQFINFRSDQNLNLDENITDLVMTNRSDFNKLYPGAKLIGIENHYPIYLWILPGENQDFFEKIGYTANPNFPTELPQSAYRSNIKIAKNKTIKINGDKLYIPLEIEHTGSDAFWANLYTIREPKYSIRLGAVLINSSEQVLLETRAELPKIIYPGQKTNITLQVDLSNIEIRNTCDLVLKIGMVHESVAWFYSMGDKMLEIRLCEYLEN